MQNTTWCVGEGPREKFINLGAAGLSTIELIAILLRTGRKGCSVLEMAREVLDSVVDGAYGLNDVTVERLQQVKGIGRDKAVTICAAVELGRRLGQMRVKHLYEDFSHPKAVATYVMERLRHEREEHFCAAFLNCKNKLIRLDTISIGGLTGSLAEQRSVFRRALEANAASLILIHNHPSGDASPSDEDVRITKIFKEAGDVMGIPVLDHIVIGDGIYVSLCEEALL
ncbi:DNA repair protein RadC [uncultured Veillonella sp.]|uniref:RadC family protein n=1 Tax=uncultured Veillonella sp. TaxID=159268 RepID=UPI0025EF5C6A|nr:DNA repair protein RadC [uncultured Veillonella sp.]MDY3974795.1 DNA repair protein RadC [Veillonella caviae]